jgi:hypothetical protein
MLGRTAVSHEFTCTRGENQLDVRIPAGLSSGTYVLRIEADGRVQSRRLLLTR